METIQSIPNKCIICHSDNSSNLGIRGTREYNGADQNAEPHIVTNVVKCNNCGFIYTNPLILGLEHLEKNHYNDTDAYKTSEIPNVSEMFQRRVEAIKKYKKQGILLDVGAGKGEFLGEAQKAGFTCVGAEPSPNFCEHIKNTYGAEIHCGYLGEIESLKKKQFDVISMLHVLEHVENPHDLMQVIKSNLNDDGILFVEVPNTDSVFLKIIDFYYKLKGLGWSSRLSPFHPPFHKFGYNKDSLTFLFKKHGFKILEINTWSGRDRGFEKREGQKSFELKLRDLAMNMVDALGNREIIYAIVRK